MEEQPLQRANHAHVRAAALRRVARGPAAARAGRLPAGRATRGCASRSLRPPRPRRLAPPALVLRDPLGLARRVVAGRRRDECSCCRALPGRAARAGGAPPARARAAPIAARRHRARRPARPTAGRTGLADPLAGPRARRRADGAQAAPEAESRPLVVLDPRGPADEDGSTPPCAPPPRSPRSRAAGAARCCCRATGAPPSIEADLRGVAERARAAGAGRHRSARRRAAARNRRGLVVYVAARPGRPGRRAGSAARPGGCLARRARRLAGRRAVFEVAGCAATSRRATGAAGGGRGERAECRVSRARGVRARSVAVPRRDARRPGTGAARRARAGAGDRPSLGRSAGVRRRLHMGPACSTRPAEPARRCARSASRSPGCRDVLAGRLAPRAARAARAASSRRVLALALLAGGVARRAAGRPLERAGRRDRRGASQALPGVRCPTAALDPWPRIVIPLGGGRSRCRRALAFWPRRARLGPPVRCAGRARRALRGPVGRAGAARPVPARRGASPCWWSPSCGSSRCASRDAGAAGVVARRRACSALVAAPAARPPHAVVRLRDLGAPTRRSKSTTFTGTTRYGPLNWPRDGRELLRVRAAAPGYWKAENLDGFDGRAGCAPAVRADADELAPPPAVDPRWTQTIRVTIRNLSTEQFITAGYATVRSTRRAAPRPARRRHVRPPARPCGAATPTRRASTRRSRTSRSAGPGDRDPRAAGVSCARRVRGCPLTSRRPGRAGTCGAFPAFGDNGRAVRRGGRRQAGA